MDTPTLVALVAAVFTVLGAVISSLFGNYSLKKQDERRFRHEEEKQNKSELRRRNTAYRRLWTVCQAVLATGNNEFSPTKILSEVQYETIQSIIAQDADVLDGSTVKAWETRGTAKAPSMANFEYLVTCETFWSDVKQRYAAIST